MLSKEDVVLPLASQLAKKEKVSKLDPLTILAIIRLIIQIIQTIIEARQGKKLGFLARIRVKFLVVGALGRAYARHSNLIGDYAANLTESEKLLLLKSK